MKSSFQYSLCFKKYSIRKDNIRFYEINFLFLYFIFLMYFLKLILSQKICISYFRDGINDCAENTVSKTLNQWHATYVLYYAFMWLIIALCVLGLLSFNVR